jgi:hypothetical protein
MMNIQDIHASSLYAGSLSPDAGALLSSSKDAGNDNIPDWGLTARTAVL